MWEASAAFVLVTWVALSSQVSPDTMHCIVRLESDYNVSAESPAGAIGVAQFMPTTHQWMAGMAKDELGFSPVLGNPVHDLVLLAWAVRHGYGKHWAVWPLCASFQEEVGNEGILRQGRADEGAIEQWPGFSAVG